MPITRMRWHADKLVKLVLNGRSRECHSQVTQPTLLTPFIITRKVPKKVVRESGTTSAGQIPGMCFRQKWQCKVYETLQTAGENCHGFTIWLSPHCGALGRNLLDKKSKSPLFPGGGREMKGVLQMIVA